MALWGMLLETFMFLNDGGGRGLSTWLLAFWALICTSCFVSQLERDLRRTTGVSQCSFLPPQLPHWGRSSGSGGGPFCSGFGGLFWNLAFLMNSPSYLIVNSECLPKQTKHWIQQLAPLNIPNWIDDNFWKSNFTCIQSHVTYETLQVIYLWSHGLQAKPSSRLQMSHSVCSDILSVK